MGRKSLVEFQTSWHKCSINVLIWYKRDLRVDDHPALTLGAEIGAVLPIYIVEPDYWVLADTSAHQWRFLAQSLLGLKNDLAQLGLPLILRTGDAVAELAKLCTKHGITKIISHQETGNLFTFHRDRRVAAWGASAGIEWVELAQSGVARPFTARDGWAKRHMLSLRKGQAHPKRPPKRCKGLMWANCPPNNGCPLCARPNGRARRGRAVVQQFHGKPRASLSRWPVISPSR